MKALSFLQPWAYAALYMGKGIENRRRKDGRIPEACKHRGRLLIHASLGAQKRYLVDAATWMLRNIYPNIRPRDVFMLHQLKNKNPFPFERGGIVGRCDVWAHMDPDGRIWLDPKGTELADEETIADAGVDRRWHMPGHYGLLLANREPLPFTPWKGCLGVFNVPEEALRR